MADANFLAKLDWMRRNYNPNPTEITPELLEKMDWLFQMIGEHVQGEAPHVLHSAMWTWLLNIAKLSLDALQCTAYDVVFDEMERLHTAKNAGYAGVAAKDPWANFRMARWFGVTPFTGCMIRMSDKLVRIKHLVENPAADQVGENIKDTLFDLAIYSLIALCLWDEERTLGFKIQRMLRRVLAWPVHSHGQ